MSGIEDARPERAVWIGYGTAPFGHAGADPEAACTRALRDSAGLVLVSLAMAPEQLAGVLRRLCEVPIERRSRIVGVGTDTPVSARGQLDVVVDAPSLAAAHREVLTGRAWEPGVGAVQSLVASTALGASGLELTPVLRSLELALSCESAIARTASNVARSGAAVDARGMSALARAGALGAPVISNGRTYACGSDRSPHDALLLGVCWARPRFVAAGVSRILDDLARRVGRELAVSRALAASSSEVTRARGNRLVDPRIGILSKEAMVLVGNSVAWTIRRIGRPLCVAVIDVVGLRRINARYGHATGDAVLSQLAETVARTLRNQDSLGFLEDDSIAVILPDITLPDAEQHLARIFGLVVRAPAHDGASNVAYEVQIGLVALAPDERVESALARCAPLANRPGRVSSAASMATSVPSAAHASFEPGDIIAGRYQVLHRIAGGVLSDVFRGTDTVLHRPVAIRLLQRDPSSDGDTSDRLFARLRRASAIQHAALCDVLALGIAGDRPYVVMELVDGASLADTVQQEALRGARMSAADVVTTLEPVAAALDLLHAYGVAHTDVRAATIIRDPFEARSVLLAPGPEAYDHDDRVTPHEVTHAIAGDLGGLATAAFTALTSMMVFDARPADANRATQWIGQGAYAEQGGDPVTSAVFDRAFGPPDERYRNASELVTALRDSLLGNRQRSSEHERAPSVGATRGLVFRAFGWVLASARTPTRPTLGPEIRELLTWEAPALAWFPRGHFEELVRWIDGADGAEALPRRAAHALVRTSFRRFFPASALTLTPVRVVQSLPLIWRRYHSWGRIEATLAGSGEAHVTLVDATCASAAAREWVAGMVEQLVALSGGAGCSSTPELGDDRDLRVTVRWSNDAHGDLRAVIGDLATRGAL